MNIEDLKKDKIYVEDLLRIYWYKLVSNCNISITKRSGGTLKGGVEYGVTLIEESLMNYGIIRVDVFGERIFGAVYREEHERLSVETKGLESMEGYWGLVSQIILAESRSYDERVAGDRQNVENALHKALKLGSQHFDW